MIFPLTPRGLISGDAFRNLMFLERDLDEVAAVVSEFEQNFCDAELRIFGSIVATCVSPRFKPR